MSVSGICSSSFANYGNNVVSRKQEFRQEFQQLGQDLQSGNLTAAQSDFSQLQQLAPDGSHRTQSNNNISTDFNQLATDLQSGNISAAQQDYSKVQQDFSSNAAQRHHHHHHDSGGGSGEIGQLFNLLGSALQAGDLSTAQQAYSYLQTDLPQFQNASSSSTSASSSSKSVSVTA